MAKYTRETFDQVMIQNYAPADFIPVKGGNILILQAELPLMLWGIVLTN